MDALARLWDGKRFKVSKGTPQLILALCDEDNVFRKKVEGRVNELAEKGYRTLSGAVGANPPKANSYHLKSPWKVADCLNPTILGGGPNPFHGFEMRFRFES